MAGSKDRTVILGIGHPDRGDDAVGRAVATRLALDPPEGAVIVASDGNATELLDILGEARRVVIIDAALSGAAPGTIRRIDINKEPLPPAKFGMSSHGMGLAEAIELARLFGQLPERCIVFAIEGASFELGEPLTAAVEGTVGAVVERVLAELPERVS